MPRLALWLLVSLAAISMGRPLLVTPMQASPLQAIVASIGGSRVDLSSLVRPGFVPHHYEPTPRQMDRLTRSTLFGRCGLPFDNAWMERIRWANPDMLAIDAQDAHQAGGETDHEHHGHTHAAQIASKIGRRVVTIDPLAGVTGAGFLVERIPGYRAYRMSSTDGLSLPTGSSPTIRPGHKMLRLGKAGTPIVKGDRSRHDSIRSLCQSPVGDHDR